MEIPNDDPLVVNKSGGGSWAAKIKSKRFLGAVVLAVLIVGVGVALATLFKKEKTVAPAPRKATVRITASGFSPTTLTIRKGTQVVWQNDDVSPHRVAANPYPVKEGAELDSGVITPGGSFSQVMNDTKTLQYHDETLPERNATITVQE